VGGLWALLAIISGARHGRVTVHAIAGLLVNIVGGLVVLFFGGIIVLAPFAREAVARAEEIERRERAARQEEQEARAQQAWVQERKRRHEQERSVSERRLGIHQPTAVDAAASGVRFPQVPVPTESEDRGVEVTSLSGAFPKPIALAADGSAFYVARRVESADGSKSFTCVEEYVLPGVSLHRRVLIRGRGQMSLSQCGDQLVLCTSDANLSRLTFLDLMPLQLKKSISLDGRHEVYGSRGLALIVHWSPPRFRWHDESSDDAQIRLLAPDEAKFSASAPVDSFFDFKVAPDGNHLLLVAPSRTSFDLFGVGDRSLIKEGTICPAQPASRVGCCGLEYCLLMARDTAQVFAFQDSSKPVAVLQFDSLLYTAAIDPVTKNVYALCEGQQGEVSFLVYTLAGKLLVQARFPEHGARFRNATMLLHPEGHRSLVATGSGSIHWVTVRSERTVKGQIQ